MIWPVQGQLAGQVVKVEITVVVIVVSCPAGAVDVVMFDPVVAYTGFSLSKDAALELELGAVVVDCGATPVDFDSEEEAEEEGAVVVVDSGVVVGAADEEAVVEEAVVEESVVDLVIVDEYEGVIDALEAVVEWVVLVVVVLEHGLVCVVAHTVWH